jgi:hypothetical protein
LTKRVLAMRQAVASDPGELSAEQHARLDNMISATDGLTAVSSASWHTTMDQAQFRFWKLNEQGAENSAARGRAFAISQLTQVGLAGGLGLAGVVLSIWYTSASVARSPASPDWSSPIR